jgi:DMSO/TMAO reductase YedYZ molybdopterin-dependent catalytic subunit
MAGTRSVASKVSTGSTGPHRSALPPGQRAIDGFPRFGTHVHRPPPALPSDPAIEITGAVTEPFRVSLARLVELPRRDLTADFHCVAGWSATDLHWEGVAFDRFYRTVIEPSLQPDATVTHLVFRGLDGYRSVVEIEDARADDVLLADRLNGDPLEPDHGAPIRLVSPRQYGFISTKHLCRIECHTQRPPQTKPAVIRIGPVTLRNPLIQPHRRARIWEEERHAHLPAWLLRDLYWLLFRPARPLSAPSATSQDPSGEDRALRVDHPRSGSPRRDRPANRAGASGGGDRASQAVD